VEILIERVTGAHEATVQLGVSKKPKEGGRIELADGSHALVLGRDEGFFRLRFEAPEPLEKLLLKLGEMPLPPYIERHADASDMERYQTVFAREPGAVEILIERVTGAHEATVQLGVSKKPKEGGRIELADGSHAVVLGRDEGFFRLRFEAPEPLEKLLLKLGEMPLPPYIERHDDASDMQRYQTEIAREPGAVAAPTAGLHFDEAILARLRERGVEFGYVTLHVGAGTFQPVRADDLKDHHMHTEWLNVGAHLIGQIRRTRANGGRVIAVGTTVVRALESASKDGELHPFAGETQIFIFPGYRFSSIDGLLTNFHLPQSTLLMLVSALAGREYMLDAYRHAVEQRYRFFSYGDSMLILPKGV
jgi:S-adenosylmethionine:tRNA ribosyltransferase-isomerase